MLENLKFHHIGMACFTLEDSMTFYEQLGYCSSTPIDDPIQGVRVCFLEKDGMPRLELLAPNNEESPINRILLTQGVTPYHICYETNNLLQTFFKLRKEYRFVVVSKPSPACAINNRYVAFMFRKDVGLIELVERNEVLCL